MSGICKNGNNGSKRELDLSVHVAHNNMAMVEDVHLMLEHAICEKLRAINLAAAREVKLTANGRA